MNQADDDHFTIGANQFLCEYVLKHLNAYLESYDETLKMRAIARQNQVERLSRIQRGVAEHNWDHRAEADIPEPQQWLPREIYALLPETAVSHEDLEGQLREVLTQAEAVVSANDDDLALVIKKIELEARRDSLIEVYLAPFRLLRLQAWTRLARLEAGVDDPVDLYTADRDDADGLLNDDTTSGHAAIAQLAETPLSDIRDGPLGLRADLLNRTIQRKGEKYSGITISLTPAQWFFFRVVFDADGNATNKTVRAAYERAGCKFDIDGRRDARHKANGALRDLGVKLTGKRLIDLDVDEQSR